MVDKNRGDKGGFMAMSGPRRMESGFSETSISSNATGFGSGSGFGLSSDVESFSTKPKGRPPSSATAPPKGLGMQLGKTKQTSQLMDSMKAEGEVFFEDEQPISVQSKPSLPPPPTDPITLTIEERLNVVIKRDGGVSGFDVQGTLSVQILNQDDGLVQFQIENKDMPGLSFKTHPNINKELFNNKHIVGLKDPNRPFPSGQNDVGLMKWRIQGLDESSLPLTVNCWPNVSGSETFVNIEYEAFEMFDLQNVLICIPLPISREPPSIKQIDGEWRYDARNSTLEWSILLVNNSHRSGSLEFVVPPADSSAFFPIRVKFVAANIFSNVKVSSVIPLRGEAKKFSQRIQLIADTYEVV